MGSEAVCRSQNYLGSSKWHWYLRPCAATATDYSYITAKLWSSTLDRSASVAVCSMVTGYPPCWTCSRVFSIRLDTSSTARAEWSKGSPLYQLRLLGGYGEQWQQQGDKSLISIFFASLFLKERIEIGPHKGQ